MSTLQIDAERCKKCGNCVPVCPERLFLQDAKGTVPKIIDAAQFAFHSRIIFDKRNFRYQSTSLKTLKRIAKVLEGAFKRYLAFILALKERGFPLCL